MTSPCSIRKPTAGTVIYLRVNLKMMTITMIIRLLNLQRPRTPLLPPWQSITSGLGNSKIPLRLPLNDDRDPG